MLAGARRRISSSCGGLRHNTRPRGLLWVTAFSSWRSASVQILRLQKRNLRGIRASDCSWSACSAANSRARRVQQYFNGLNDQVPGAELLRFDCCYEAADLSCLDAVTAGKPKINLDIDNLDAAMKGIFGERLLGRVWARDYSRRRGHQVHWALLISPNRSAPDPISLIAHSWSEITSGAGSLYDARVPNAAFQFRGLSVPIGHYFQSSTAEFIRRTAVFMGATALYSKHLSVGTTFSHH